MFIKALFFILGIIAFYSTAFSQSDSIRELVPEVDNRPYTLTQAQAQMLFDGKFYNKYGYIDGKEYKPYHTRGQSTPFLKGERGTGSLSYDGKSYPDLFLLYDINKDELLNIPNLATLASNYITINKAHIDSFTISVDNETFHLRQLFFPQGTNIPMENGFYELAYEGTIQYFIKHRVVSNTNSGYTNYSYTPVSYFLKNGHYFKIKSKGRFVKLFPEHKKLLKKKVRSYYTSYKSLSKYQIIEILQFAESL